MKKLYFLASLVLAGCNAPETATLVVKTEPNTEVIYWGAGKDEMYSFKLGTKDTTNAEGFMTYQVELTEPKTLAVNAMRQAAVTYLTPGSCDTLTITKDTVMFAGNNSAYNQCLLEVEKYQKYCNNILLIGVPHELNSVKTPDELREKYSVHYNKAATVIQNSGLPVSFVKEQMAHLDYISRLIVAYITMYTVKDKTDEWKAAFKKIADMDWNNDAMCSYRGVSMMSRQLPMMKFFILENGNRNEVKEPYRFMFDRCKDWFDGKALERVWAAFIYDDILNEGHTEAFIGLYEEFKRTYPESPYLPALQPGMDETIRFHQAELDETKYHVIPYDQTMTSISEALKPLRGKVVYVDVWATWCGPCKEMFTHVPAFKEKAKDLDVTYLYLSIDQPQAEKTWRKAIPYYQLKGYHLLAGQELTSAVYRELGNEHGTLTIPRFLIVDKEGNIVVPNAASPDQPEKLIEQLKAVLAK